MLSIASCGGGTSLHLSSELFKAMVGVALTQLARLGGSFCDFARARVNLIKGLG
jgi:hypothetical protein